MRRLVTRCPVRFLRVFAASAACALGGVAQATFFDWQGTAVDGHVGETHCCPGDLNGDGFPDVISSRRSTGATVDRLDFRSGRDGALLSTLTTPNGLANLHATGDVDGDGVGDYAYNVPISPTNWQLTVRSGATNAVVWTYAAGGVPPDVFRPDLAGAGRDYDGDGVGDLVTAAQWVGLSTQVRVRVRSGVNGALIAEYAPAATGYYFVYPTPDITGDGIPDVVLTGPAVGFVGILAAPAMTLVATIPPPPAPAAQFGLRAGAAGDSDGDGLPDVALTVFGDASIGAAFGDVSTRVYAGVGFAYAYSVLWDAVASGGRTEPIEDVDGDGKIDFVQYGGSGVKGVAGFRVSSAATGTEILSHVDADGDGVFVRGADFDFNGVREFLFSDHADAAIVPAGGRLRVFSFSAAEAGILGLGGSCGAGAGLGGTFSATSPILGQLVTFSVTGAAASTGGNFVFDVGFPVALPLDCGGVFHLDLLHYFDWIFAPVGTDAIGAASVALPLPSWPFASGFPVVAQAVFWPTSSSYGFDVTNGLQLILGY